MRKAGNYLLLLILLLTVTVMLFGCNSVMHDHKWGVWLDNGDGTHYRVCRSDYSHRETSPHTFSDYVIKKAATDVKPGEKYRTCTGCGYTETVKIPYTGDHNFNLEIKDPKYLYRQTSEYSALYYKSCECGAYGNPDCIFEDSRLPEGYSDIECIQGTGLQYIDTGIEYKEGTGINYNVSKGLSKKLPEGYIAVEYIEGDGTQAVPTNIIISSDFTIAADVALTNTDETSAIWCSRGETTSAYTSTAFYTDSGIRVDYGISAEKTYIEKPAKNERFTLEKYRNKWYLNGELKKTCTEQTYTSPNGLMFFACYSGDINSNIASKSYLKMYSAVVYNGSKPLAVFIPCYRDSDKKAGLFDVCNGDFYTTIMGHQFTTGPVIDAPSDTPSVHSGGIEIPDELKRLRYIDFLKDYDSLEYIESSGTQYIDTGYSPSVNVRIKAKVRAGSTQTQNSAPLIGVRLGKSNNNRLIPIGFDNTYNLRTTLGSEEYKNVGTVGSDLNVDFDAKNKISVINGVQYDFAGTTFVKEANNNLYLFNVSGYTTSYNATGRIYYVEVYDEDVLIRELIPARNKATGEVGLYDLVEGKFYTNEGTGEFIAGDSVVFPSFDNILIGYDYSSMIPSYRYLKIYDALINDGEKDHLLIPALRNSDSKIGMYDLTDNVFYTGDYAQFESEGLATHLSGTTEIVKEASLDEEGLCCFTCSICGEKIYKVIPKKAFKAEFEYDSGVDGINVLRTPYSKEYEKADSAYSRNIYSYNYSVINAGVVILPDIKEGFVIDSINTDNKLAEIIIKENGIIEIRNIVSDIKITIKTKSAS